jgi:hypothetical protein
MPDADPLAAARTTKAVAAMLREARAAWRATLFHVPVLSRRLASVPDAATRGDACRDQVAFEVGSSTPCDVALRGPLAASGTC